MGRRRSEPDSGKRAVRKRDPDNSASQRPTWRMGTMDMDAVSDWGWGALTAEEADGVRKSLIGFESMTWGELCRQSTPRAKRIPISNLCRRAQQRLEAMRQDDADALWELRIDGPKRVWGIRVGDAFELLWWDPTHSVCPSTLRHT